MTDQDLKPGTVVYHKAHDLKMVILGVQEEKYYCRFVDSHGEFDSKDFFKFEVTTNKPTNINRQLSASKKD